MDKNKSKLHVLIIPSEHFITEWSPLGGIFQLDLARGLRLAGNEVGILSVGRYPKSMIFLEKKYNKYEAIDGVNVVRNYIQFPLPFNLVGNRIYTWLFTKMANRIYDEYVARNGEPDIIHAHNFLYAGCVAANISKRRKIPFVVTEHSSAAFTNGISAPTLSRLKAIAEFSSGVSAVSKKFYNVLKEKLNLNFNNFNIIPNALPKEFEDLPIFDKTAQSGQKFVFINVAELILIKNQQLLLQAFAKGFKKTNTCLKIIGDGPCKADLINLVNDLGISSQVEMLGRLNRTQVREHMRQSDSFVFSSDAETFGVVLIEALSQGLPVVSTDCGGPSDIITKNNGILTQPKNLKELTDAMCVMRNQRAQFDSLAIAIECHNKYGKTSIAKQYINFYLKAISEFK